MSLTLLRHWETIDEAINAVAFLGSHWPLAEAAGELTAFDDTKNWRNGAYSGSVTPGNIIAPDGRPAALFSGGHVQIPDYSVFSVETGMGFTAGALIKPSATITSLRFILTKGSSSNYEWDLRAGNGGTADYEFVMHTPTGGVLSARRTNTAPLGTDWKLVIANVQGRGRSNQVDLYTNGVLASSATLTDAAGTYGDGSSVVRIGARGDNNADPFAGHIRHAFCFPDAIGIGSVKRIAEAMRREAFF